MLSSSVDLKSIIHRLLEHLQSHQYLVLFGILILYILLVRYRRGLRHIPGPWLTSISSIWRSIVVWRQDMPAMSIRLHKKHGPLVRIEPHHVSIADPEAVKIIYGVDGRYPKLWQKAS